jgi:hypothetical protein
VRTVLRPVRHGRALWVALVFRPNAQNHGLRIERLSTRSLMSKAQLASS